MATPDELVKELLSAHHHVVAAEINMARDEDSPMHYSWALAKVEKAEKRFMAAIDAVRNRLGD